MNIKSRIDCANLIAGLRLRLSDGSEIVALELPKSIITKIKWEFIKNSDYKLGSDISIDGVELMEVPDGEKPAWVIRFPFSEANGGPGEMIGLQENVAA